MRTLLLFWMLALAGCGNKPAPNKYAAPVVTCWQHRQQFPCKQTWYPYGPQVDIETGDGYGNIQIEILMPEASK